MIKYHIWYNHKNTTPLPQSHFSTMYYIRHRYSSSVFSGDLSSKSSTNASPTDSTRRNGKSSCTQACRSWQCSACRSVSSSQSTPVPSWRYHVSNPIRGTPHRGTWYFANRISFKHTAHSTRRWCGMRAKVQITSRWHFSRKWNKVWSLLLEAYDFDWRSQNLIEGSLNPWLEKVNYLRKTISPQFLRYISLDWETSLRSYSILDSTHVLPW